jgi:Ni,Fe-hydrogenase III small subunit
MSKWVWKGLRTGKKSTLYPNAPETAVGVSPGLPRTPTGALPLEFCPFPVGQIEGGEEAGKTGIRDCVHCFRCVRSASSRVEWQEGYEWAMRKEVGSNGESRRFGAAFHRSLHIRMVDAGGCGACISEVKQIAKPCYSIHRLGFFITPTPRQADVLLVVGPVTDNMVFALKKAYDAMPAPKLVVAAGTCALTGGLFGPGYSCGAGVADFLPVDVEVPGCPPPPLAIIHALLVAVGRKPSASLPQDASVPEGRTL